MTHDPRTYKDPFIFSPDRFLGESPELDPYELCFGFGRRQVDSIRLQFELMAYSAEFVLACILRMLAYLSPAPCLWRSLTYRKASKMVL